MRWVAFSLLLLSACSRSSESSSGVIQEAGAPTPQIVADTSNVTPQGAATPAVSQGEIAVSQGKAEQERCPANMILVEGMYCPNTKQECVDWIEDPAQFPYARCRKFKEPSGCKGERVPMAFCIDREEYSAPKEELPQGDTSWTEAKQTCESQGKRLCQESEWTFACEGEEMKPYPYGYERNPAVCNFEQQDLVDRNKGKMYDLRQPSSANLQCLSPFGVHNMVGNIDEWVVLDKPHYSEKNNGRKMMSGLKGGWWGPLRNRCRPVTVDHDEIFKELQTGFRCCADAKGKMAQNDAKR